MKSTLTWNSIWDSYTFILIAFYCWTTHVFHWIVRQSINWFVYFFFRNTYLFVCEWHGVFFLMCIFLWNDKNLIILHLIQMKNVNLLGLIFLVLRFLFCEMSFSLCFEFVYFIDIYSQSSDRQIYCPNSLSSMFIVTCVIS